VGQKQDEEGSAQLEVGKACSGLIQGTTNVAEGSNAVGFAVISSLAEQERLAAQERNYPVRGRRGLFRFHPGHHQCRSNIDYFSLGGEQRCGFCSDFFIGRAREISSPRKEIFRTMDLKVIRGLWA
jgi:hypothetical protein